LLVDQEYRQQGLGSALYERTEQLFREEGLKRISLGAELGHFFPGIPKESVETQTFFLNRGYTGAGEFCDLNCTRARFVPPAGHEMAPDVVKETRIALAKSEQDVREAQAFFLQYFPGRWEHEFRWAVENGVLDGLVLLWVNGVVKGFARIYDAESRFIGPSIYWGEQMGTPYGGLGPIGVAHDERGKGLGMELLYRSLMMLQDRGVEEMVIDFTTLVEFYGKLGFEPWKWYVRLVKDLA
jgi:GNAT superfamily N-acetyltransferase